jgi:DNA-binding NarL/FixJ family response regulator
VSAVEVEVRVMIVDDHRIVREGLSYMLGALDDVELVGEAGSGSEFLELLPRADPDVVLLDVRMPGMSGLEALEHVRRKHPSVKVIMLSMHDQAAYVQQAVELGAFGYLLKSAGLDELRRALDSVIAGHPYLQGELAAALISIPETAERPHLSPTQLEVLELLSLGRENKQIARKLGISEATVKTHVKALFGRLGVRSRAEAVATALRLGLID